MVGSFLAKRFMAPHFQEAFLFLGSIKGTLKPFLRQLHLQFITAGAVWLAARIRICLRPLDHYIKYTYLQQSCVMYSCHSICQVQPKTSLIQFACISVALLPLWSCSPSTGQQLICRQIDQTWSKYTHCEFLYLCSYHLPFITHNLYMTFPIHTL